MKQVLFKFSIPAPTDVYSRAQNNIFWGKHNELWLWQNIFVLKFIVFAISSIEMLLCEHSFQHKSIIIQSGIQYVCIYTKKLKKGKEKPLERK